MSLDMVINTREVNDLTDLSRKIDCSSELRDYLERSPATNRYACTLTFHNGKFYKFQKHQMAKIIEPVRFTSADADDIHQVVAYFFAKYCRGVKYYFRLDIGKKNRFHYHGIMVPDNRFECITFITNWNKFFGQTQNGLVQCTRKWSRYVCGDPTEDGMDLLDPTNAVKCSKVGMKQWLDTYISTNIYICHSCSSDSD